MSSQAILKKISVLQASYIQLMFNAERTAKEKDILREITALQHELKCLQSKERIRANDLRIDY